MQSCNLVSLASMRSFLSARLTLSLRRFRRCFNRKSSSVIPTAFLREQMSVSVSILIWLITPKIITTRSLPLGICSRPPGKKRRVVLKLLILHLRRSSTRLKHTPALSSTRTLIWRIIRWAQLVSVAS